MDPRVLRSRAAAEEAARALFLRNGYAATTMEDIAERAGLSRRTLYNLYPDKEAVFVHVVQEVVTYAGRFADDLAGWFAAAPADDPAALVRDLGRHLGRSILKPEVVALRRLLVSERASFPGLAEEYFERAPGRVMDALASGFEELAGAGSLRVIEPRRAAEQFAYLVAGPALDRAILLGTLPTTREIDDAAGDGAETFLARYGVGPGA